MNIKCEYEVYKLVCDMDPPRNSTCPQVHRWRTQEHHKVNVTTAWCRLVVFRSAYCSWVGIPSVLSEKAVQLFVK